MALGLVDTVGCVDDQSMLYHFFTQTGYRVNLLPFAYNVRRQNYHPMRIYHFGGERPAKPWQVPLSREQAENVALIDLPLDMYKVWWFNLYEAIDRYKLHDWWAQTSLYADLQRTTSAPDRGLDQFKQKPAIVDSEMLINGKKK